MKTESNAGSKSTMLIQLAIGDDHVNRLKGARVVLWGQAEGGKTPLATVALEVLEVALAHPEEMRHLVYKMLDRAKFLGTNWDGLKARLLHCPDSHRCGHAPRLDNGLRVPATPFDTQRAGGN
jgi:hypothetical protein